MGVVRPLQEDRCQLRRKCFVASFLNGEMLIENAKAMYGSQFTNEMPDVSALSEENAKGCHIHKGVTV